MADRKNNPRGTTRPQHGEFDATELTNQFEQLLSTKRLNHLASQSRFTRSSSPSPLHHSSSPSRNSRSSASTSVPPSYSSLRNIPKIATPPQDPASLKFRNLLITVSMTPLKYENPGLLDEALEAIGQDALSRIYGEAEDENAFLQAQAASIGENQKPEWGYQDCVIRALLRYVVVLVGG